MIITKKKIKEIENLYNFKLFEEAQNYIKDKEAQDKVSFVFAREIGGLVRYLVDKVSYQHSDLERLQEKVDYLNKQLEKMKGENGRLKLEAEAQYKELDAEIERLRGELTKAARPHVWVHDLAECADEISPVGYSKLGVPFIDAYGDTWQLGEGGLFYERKGDVTRAITGFKWTNASGPQVELKA